MKLRLVIDIERCKGCALCVSACGRDVLEMSKKLNTKGYYYAEAEDENDCVGCLQCAVVCPDAAIEIIQEDM
jgi:2-oxoglutarate ferredoxin oxidoreductase subunit delta